MPRKGELAVMLSPVMTGDLAEIQQNPAVLSHSQASDTIRQRCSHTIAHLGLLCLDCFANWNSKAVSNIFASHITRYGFPISL